VTTSTPSLDAPPSRVAIVGTGLIGTSVALAAARAGCDVTGWDPNPMHAERAAASGGLRVRSTLDQAVSDAELVVVCAPIAAIPGTVASVLRLAPAAVVTDAGSIKSQLVAEVAALTAEGDAGSLARYVPSHPMGGSERSGPEHASASVVDDIVWVVAPSEWSDEGAVATLEGFIRMIGARPVRLSPERHDRLVAVVSHLPQLASTALMGLAATEEADEPEILLLAAGGFRDLTRLAASNPSLWSGIVLANREEIARAIDLFAQRLMDLRAQVAGSRAEDVERTFEEAKRARLRLAAKPQVRAGVAVLQVEIPDRPGALALLTSSLGEGGVNIEDLQIVHSPEGGRGTVHVTIAASAAEDAARVLTSHRFDPIRLA
jgi:prephenate dehydrogenase